MPNEQMMLGGQIPTSAPPMPTPAEAEAMMASMPPGDMESMMASLPPEMTSGIGSLVNAEQAPMVPEAGIGSLPQMTDQLAAMGREGDIYVVHASEGDTVIPMDVLNANPQLKDMLFAQIGDMGYEPERYIVGNELNSINPETGLPEFFFKKLFKGLKSIAKIALPIALAYFGPAAWAAMSAAGAGTAAAGTAAALSTGASAAAAGAGSALGTALTGGDLKQIAISGGLGALSGGLGAKANTIPFTEAAAADATAKAAADAAAKTAAMGIDPTRAYTESQILDLAKSGVEAQAGRYAALGQDLRGGASLSQAGAGATQAITSPTISQRIMAGLTPFRDEAGKKLAMNAAGNLVPTSMSAFRAALPLGATALGATALMGGGGYGENPDNVFGDPTQEEIDAKRTYFENYPSRLADSYNPVVPAGRSYNRSLASTGTRYARDGGLASFLPVRKMAIGGPVLSPQQLRSLTPSQQLDSINAQYANEYNSAVGGPNATMSEQQWVNSPRFQEYENAVIGSTRALSQAGVANQGFETAPVDQSGLRFQMNRAQDPNNIYSGSAQRIADAMANVATSGDQTPAQMLSQMNATAAAQAAAAQAAADKAAADKAAAAKAAADKAAAVGNNTNYNDPNNFIILPDGSVVYKGLGDMPALNLMNPGLTTFPTPAATPPADPTAGAPADPTAGAPVDPPVNLPQAVDPFAGGYQYYESNPARIQQLQSVEPQVSNAAGLFSQGVQQAANRRQQLQEPETAKMAAGGRVYGPRREGRVPGPLGIERDIVPTDLMPGEFVFTKDAVEGVGKLAGGGFTDGIKTMYGLMKRFEGVA